MQFSSLLPFPAGYGAYNIGRPRGGTFRYVCRLGKSTAARRLCPPDRRTDEAALCLFPRVLYDIRHGIARKKPSCYNDKTEKTEGGFCCAERKDHRSRRDRGHRGVQGGEPCLASRQAARGRAGAHDGKRHEVHHAHHVRAAHGQQGARGYVRPQFPEQRRAYRRCGQGRFRAHRAGDRECDRKACPRTRGRYAHDHGTGLRLPEGDRAGHEYENVRKPRHAG